MSNFAAYRVMSQMEFLHVLKEQKHRHQSQDPRENFPQLECKRYGFDCEFVANGRIENIIKDFRKHTLQEHYIDYPEGVIMKFISRKYGKVYNPPPETSESSIS